jgi:hypothetical protein
MCPATKLITYKKLSIFKYLGISYLRKFFSQVYESKAVAGFYWELL